MNEISDQQVIEWLRAKALTLLTAADALEGQTSRAPKMNSASVSLEEVRNFVRDKSARVSDIARFFSCSENKIRNLISAEDSGLIDAGRGWVKLQPTEDEDDPFEI